MSRGIDHYELVAVNADLRAGVRRLGREVERLWVEGEVLREAAAPLIHHAAAHERFVFIHRLRGRFTIERLCRIVVTDRSTSCAWARAEGRRQARAEQERELTELIVQVHAAHPAYGAERVTRELKRLGFEAGRRRVARLMREHGIAGITRRRRRSLTRPDAGAAVVPDLIRREFTAPMPGLKLSGDITCFATREGWVYLATAVDLCSREVLGYAIAPHMRTSLAIDAIIAAHRAGLVAGNAIMHTDRGSQYHAKAYRNAPRRLEMRQSTGRTGSCLDGAAAESFFATIKTEIGVESWPDRAGARRDIENWITAYNERRLHASLGYKTPIEARTAWQERMSTEA